LVLLRVEIARFTQSGALAPDWVKHPTLGTPN
jgi:hypothetical protein